MQYEINHGDCLEVLRQLPSNSFDGLLSDPPYALAFMGKDWDKALPPVAVWQECLRVLKPGGLLLAFGGTRTFHRLTCSIEDAGFQIRDCLTWLHGQGFPKSLDVGKSIDKTLGVTREPIGQWQGGGFAGGELANSKREGSQCVKDGETGMGTITAPATPEAQQWDGWGTALKPAWEPIILAQRKPEGSFASNALKYGCGGLNIDGCRIGTGERFNQRCGNKADHTIFTERKGCYGGNTNKDGAYKGKETTGRFPANLLLDEEAAQQLDEQAGIRQAGNFPKKQNPHVSNSRGKFNGITQDQRPMGKGGASRFFYVAKASRNERDKGLDSMPLKFRATMGNGIGERPQDPEDPKAHFRNTHPTVKPIALARYLATLILPPERETPRRILVPYSGSGSEMIGALLAGWEEIVGIEREEEYVNIACQRLEEATQ